MFISSAMCAVVTLGSPERLNSARLVSRIRSRVRRGGLRAMAPSGCRRAASRGPQSGQLPLEVIERTREIAGRLPHAARTVAEAQRSRVAQRVGDAARRVVQPGVQRQAVAA